MTQFALTLWVWQQTGSATALTLITFFSQLPSLAFTIFAGVIVDRANRKNLLILADAIAVLSSLVLLALYVFDSLQIWHLYLLGAINSSFTQLQQLTYNASLTLILPPQHYTRASSMGSALHYGSAIVAPALAATLYPLIDLSGILGIDILTFSAAFGTLLSVSIPQPQRPLDTTPDSPLNAITLKASLLEGFQYILQRAALRRLLIVTAAFWFFHDLGGALYDPLILARTQGDAGVLASMSGAAGIGGVMGAVVVSVWGGSKHRLGDLRGGMIGAGISKICFGLGRSPLLWLPAQFCSSLNFPLIGSSELALWMGHVSPEIQGRVFAAQSLILQGFSAIAALLAGPLAEIIFEPAMTSETLLSRCLGWLVGTNPGAGIAIIYVLCSIAMLAVGGGLYRFSATGRSITN